MLQYEDYKDSQIDWLSQIPSHWEEKKLKHITRIDNSGDFGLDPEFGDRQYPVATTAQISNDGVFDVDKMPIRGFYAREAERYSCKEGDILVVKSSGSIANVISGKAGIVDKETPEFIFSNFLLRLAPMPSTTCAKYIYYLVSGYLTRERVNRMVAGSTYPNLRVGEYVSALLPFPPLNEQNSIAAFLDRKTAQIDQAVAIKEQQIALLKERKQILIQNTVTRGLNPDAPMRDSGVEWIGEIPEHWEVRRSKFVFGQRKELAWKDDVQLSATQAYGVIPQELYEEKTGYRVVKIQFHLEKRKHVEVDDFVISMRSFQGGLERAWSRGCIRSSYVVLRPLLEVDAGYFGRLFKSPRYISALQATANFIRDGQDLNFENYSLVDLILPPLPEQREIAERIDAESAKIDKAIDLQQQQIDRLKEYKSTLINSAVTGKIKVPGVEEHTHDTEVA